MGCGSSAGVCEGQHGREQLAPVFIAGLGRRFAEACDAQAFVQLRRSCRFLAAELATNALILQLAGNVGDSDKDEDGAIVRMQSSLSLVCAKERLVEWMLRQQHVDGSTVFTACVRNVEGIVGSGGGCGYCYVGSSPSTENDDAVRDLAWFPPYVNEPTRGWEALTPLLVCATRNWEHAAYALLSCHADTSLADWRGMTPLHCAAAEGFDKICLALLQARADVRLRGNHVVRHQTALEMATADCATLIRAHHLSPAAKKRFSDRA